MLKYYYNPEDCLVIFSDGRKFSIDMSGNIYESYEPFKLFESDIPCSSSTEAFERLIDGYVESLAEELEDKKRELVAFENEQLKSINLLRKEVRKYECNIL
jgi:hypothetical protein